jgi:hypothetical protein
MQAREAKLDKPSVLHAKHHPEVFMDMRFKRDALLGERHQNKGKYFFF